jgi:microcystin-dependent protein
VCPIYEDDPSIWTTDAFGGDVSGTYSNLSVIRLQGRPVSSTAPSTGQALLWNGTNWIPGNVSGVPVGTVAAFLNTVPSDWLELVGGTANRITDANLFAYVGTLYGAGDGSTTFGIPDARGRTFIGAGTGPGLTLRTLAATLGAESVALSSANNGAHTHGPSAGFTGFWLWNPAGPTTMAAGANWNMQAAENTATASSGSGTPHENMQPSLVIRWAVKR